jgi:hypothetical protein
MHTHCCTKVRLAVHYVAADKPFHDHHADPDETVGHLKHRVLHAFGLAEGTTGDGNQIVYTLREHKTPLDNMNQPIGELAGHDCELKLKLVQQLIQGANA